VVTHQLQVERRTAKGHRPKTDALPLDYATKKKKKKKPQDEKIMAALFYRATIMMREDVIG